jgi:hypothetical protein
MKALGDAFDTVHSGRRSKLKNKTDQTSAKCWLIDQTLISVAGSKKQKLVNREIESIECADESEMQDIRTPRGVSG